jgi:hypothetical protein
MGTATRNGQYPIVHSAGLVCRPILKALGDHFVCLPESGLW